MEGRKADEETQHIGAWSVIAVHSPRMHRETGVISGFREADGVF